MTAKKGLIHLGLIVLVLVGLAGLASVATLARNSSTGRSFSIRLDKPHGPCSPIADVNNDSKVDDNDRVLILSYRASSWSRRPHMPYAIQAPTGAAAQSTDLRDGHKFYLVPSRGDLNSDGQVDYTDARMIKDFLLSRIDTFPRCAQGAPAALPDAPAWTNQGQLTLSALNTESTSATIAWTGQVSTGFALNLFVWKGDCVHPRNAGEYYSNTTNIANYGRAQLLWWDSPTSSITVRNLSPGQRYCAYAASGLRGPSGNEGLVSYSNDLTVTTGSSTGSAAGGSAVSVSEVPPCGTIGDTNQDGRVNSSDIAPLQKMVSLPPSSVGTSPDWNNADLDGNGNVTTTDLALLQQYLAGIIGKDQIPACSQTSNPNSGTTSKNPPCGSLGDVNGDSKITDSDAVAILNHVAGTAPLNNNGLIKGDVNGDTLVNAKDAALIRQYLASLFDNFPAPVCQPQAPSGGSTGSQPAPCLGDFNGDRKIDAADVTILTGKYRSTDPAYDLNGDGIVNVADITKEISMVGTVCP